MIYLNNAATSYPKPPCVLEANDRALRSPPASQFRGGSGPDALGEARAALAQVLGARDASRVFFTSGATEALNTVLRGLSLRQRRVAVTQAEHNSVLRPLHNAPEFQGALPVVLPCDATGHVRIEDARRLLTQDVGALVVSHVSNVTGAQQDMRRLGRLAHARGALLIVDASQSAGCVPVETDDWRADAAVFTGHKALMGPQGTGGFYLRDSLRLRPLLFGGTGADSARLSYGDQPYEYEAGTRNAPGIQALCAGVRYVLDLGIENIMRHERAQLAWLSRALERVPNVRIHSGGADAGPVLSFNIEGMKPSDVSFMLSGYDIVTRSGLQCAPLIHGALGTGSLGVVRVSISHFTTDQELQALLDAVEDIAKAGGG